MKIREQLESLKKRLEIEANYKELQKALTHKSFYNEKNEQKANSRYVFAGMYAFKGKVAEILFSYFPATGTQLQHFLGNVFKNSYLEEIFNIYDLKEIIRYGANFPAQTHKHIFVYGLLGFMQANASAEILKKFIINNFLVGKEHLFPQTHKGDIFSQCNYFSRILYGKKITPETKKTDSELYVTEIYVNNNNISTAESKSYRYSRKKALKDALKFLSEKVSEQYTNTPEYKQKQMLEELLKNKEDALMKEQKLLKHNEKVEKKKAENKIKRQKLKEEAQNNDQKRREAKQKANERNLQIQKLKEKKEREIENLSVAKRRHLQDKGHLD